MTDWPNRDNQNLTNQPSNDTRQSEEERMPNNGLKMEPIEGQLLSVVFNPDGNTTVQIKVENKLITAKF